MTAAKRLLAQYGYVTIKEKSYRQAQERQRVAEALRDAAERDKAAQRAWMERDVFPWERHLVNRLNHMGDLARRLGATDEDMAGPPCGCGMSSCRTTQKGST